jgi:NTE family protein
MGGLVGGAFAAGMSSSEIARMIEATDWTEMFSSSAYRYKTIARKEDARAYPSRLELEVRGRAALPSALNNGQRVDLFLARIGSLYAGVASFDSLPTPFRCVAVDLLSAAPVVFDSGSLTLALRATMSLPGIFPPIESDDRLLVDGGLMNNVPADVARAMGADVVVAVNVGRLPGRREVRTTLFSVVSSTTNALMRANTSRGLEAADIVVNPTLEQFGRFDWPYAETLAQEGYRATDARRDELLRYAVDDAEWQRYLARREARRRVALPIISAVDVLGAVPGDLARIQRRVQQFVGQRLDPASLDRELIRLSALDRYESVAWDVRRTGDVVTLLVLARQRSNAPPLAMFALNVQNITSDDFSFQVGARYLAFDIGSRNAELRVDVALGSDPHLAAEWRRPLGGSGLFVATSAAAARARRDLTVGDDVVAQYDQRLVSAGGDVGFTFGSTSELRGGVTLGRTELRIRVGPPDVSRVAGFASMARIKWVYDGQTHYFLPRSGARLLTGLRYVFASPDPPASSGITRSNDHLVQADVRGSRFWDARHERDRVFISGAAATSFSGQPLATAQFEAGRPLILDGYGLGERRGDHLAALSGGYLYQLSHLPDFFGGGVYAGTWLELGSAFDAIHSARLEVQFGGGLMIETLVGPAILAGAMGVHGERRVYLGFGGILP